MNVDSPPPPTPDPNLAAEQQQAHNDLVSGLQMRTTSDMASLMARYGTQLVLAGTATGSPLATTTAPIPRTM